MGEIFGDWGRSDLIEAMTSGSAYAFVAEVDRYPVPGPGEWFEVAIETEFVTVNSVEPIAQPGYPSAGKLHISQRGASGSVAVGHTVQGPHGYGNPVTMGMTARHAAALVGHLDDDAEHNAGKSLGYVEVPDGAVTFARAAQTLTNWAVQFRPGVAPIEVSVEIPKLAVAAASYDSTSLYADPNGMGALSLGFDVRLLRPSDIDQLGVSIGQFFVGLPARHATQSSTRLNPQPAGRAWQRMIDPLANPYELAPAGQGDPAYTVILRTLANNQIAAGDLSTVTISPGWMAVTSR